MRELTIPGGGSGLRLLGPGRRLGGSALRLKLQFEDLRLGGFRLGGLRLRGAALGDARRRGARLRSAAKRAAAALR